MKITASAVAALGCIHHASAFMCPKFTTQTLRSSKVEMEGKSVGEVPTWVGPATTAVAGMVFAAQTVGATSVDLPVPPSLAFVEIPNGKRFNESWDAESCRPRVDRHISLNCCTFDAQPLVVKDGSSRRLSVLFPQVVSRCQIRSIWILVCLHMGLL